MNLDEQKKKTVYELLIKALSDDNSSNNTEDDITFRKKTTEQISTRDAEYSKLLQHFVEITRIRNKLKEIFKWSFYFIVISAIFALIIIVYRLFNKYVSSANIEQILESSPLLITAMVGFVSTIITIPVTITKYLFSTDEDKNITQIILHTQEHDTSGRQWAMEFKKIADGLEQIKPPKSDDDLRNLVAGGKGETA